MGIYNTDGNLAALNAYQREQDALEAADLELEAAQVETANDLYDAYFTNKQDVIDEVDDALTDTLTTGNLINKLREAGTVECQRPVMGRGCELWDAYRKLIDAVCLEIAQRCETMEELERFRLDFNL